MSLIDSSTLSDDISYSCIQVEVEVEVERGVLSYLCIPVAIIHVHVLPWCSYMYMYQESILVCSASRHAFVALVHASHPITSPLLVESTCIMISARVARGEMPACAVRWCEGAEQVAVPGY